MHVKRAHPVAHHVNNEIHQHDMAFYSGTLEINFIGTCSKKRSNKNSVIVGIFSFYDPPNSATYLHHWSDDLIDWIVAVGIKDTDLAALVEIIRWWTITTPPSF